jgi:hypothetical protein
MVDLNLRTQLCRDLPGQGFVHLRAVTAVVIDVMRSHFPTACHRKRNEG